MTSLIFLCLAAVCNAVMDKLQFHYTKSVFWDWYSPFWDPKLSWKNKWKMRDNGEVLKEEKFWGSSRWFVMFTDGWHLSQSLMLTLLALSIVSYSPMVNVWIDFVVFRIAWGAVFELFFSLILSKDD